MEWRQQTSVMLSSADRSIPVILPVASIEQHGPHLPLSTDSDIAEHFVERINEELGDRVLTLPLVSTACSAHHMEFPGSLTTSHETFIRYGCDILESVILHGFKNLIVFNSHGGNQAACRIIAEKIGIKQVDCNVFTITWWDVANDELIRLSDSGTLGTGHACEMETSLMLHINPALVKTSDIPNGRSYIETAPVFDSDLLHGSPAGFIRSMKEISGGSGVVGNPSTSSLEKGKKISAIVTHQLVKIIRASVTVKR